jgi:hypothetical protein
MRAIPREAVALDVALPEDVLATNADSECAFLFPYFGDCKSAIPSIRTAALTSKEKCL